MAEAALFSLASKLLSTIASPAFESAYERAQLIWGTKEELHKFKMTIEAIQAVLLDAEKKHEGNPAVKVWIKRVRDVLYDADDLFDEIATDDLFKKHMKGKRLLRKVHVFFSQLNPLVSRYIIAKRVQVIRKSLLEISDGMHQFGFVKCLSEESIFVGGQRVETGSFIDPKQVTGRDEDKKTILKFLLDNSCAEENISVFAIVGIGGMGKTTLAQLVYNDEKVQKKFEKKWWACISDVLEDKEVIGRIFQSITEKSYHKLQMNKLESDIRDSISKSGKFLLVLDDVWDDNHGKWLKIMSLLSNGVKGSKIIVTTRSWSVAKAIDAVKTHPLGGLSEDESWELFKRIAFTPEQKNNQNWTSLGREIVMKCSNVPLAIKSIASLLYTKATMAEWKYFKDCELSNIALRDNSIMDVLKLSYNHLPSYLKQCFAYCSLFPKDFVIYKVELICLWISQGYVKPISENQTVEEAGHTYFMELLRRSFFQERKKDEDGEVHCKMHDLVHDLAQMVAGDESTMRQFSVRDQVDDSWKIPPPLLNVNRLRSCLFMRLGSLSPRVFDEQLTKFKFLRALRLPFLGIQEVPSSIGELKHLRYLNLSGNEFKYLPDSITKLLNLLSLDISWCEKLAALPNDFIKLINLRRMNNTACHSLRYMPHSFADLTSLQYLSCFKVGKVDCPGGKKSGGIDTLARLMLKGKLSVEFDTDINDWDGDEYWQLPVTVRVLEILHYPGMRIPYWGQGRVNMDIPSLMPNIVVLELTKCKRVKHLPGFKRLPHLKILTLREMDELEYVEEDEEQKEGRQGATAIATATSSTMVFFPFLETLYLDDLPKLKGWSKEVEVATTSKCRETEIVTDEEDDEERLSSMCPSPPHQIPSFPILSSLDISSCRELKSLPLSPRLETLILNDITHEQVSDVLINYFPSIEELMIEYSEDLESVLGEDLTSLQYLEIRNCYELKKVHLPPKNFNVLKELSIENCQQLESVSGEALTSLRKLEIIDCYELKKVPLPPKDSNVLEELVISACPELESLLGEALKSLRSLRIGYCNNLKKVHLPPMNFNVLEELEISGCTELELWEKEKRGVDWDSLPKLRRLRFNEMQIPERLPDCLQEQKAANKLKIEAFGWSFGGCLGWREIWRLEEGRVMEEEQQWYEFTTSFPSR